jgi:hypothetical protein
VPYVLEYLDSTPASLSTTCRHLFYVPLKSNARTRPLFSFQDHKPLYAYEGLYRQNGMPQCPRSCRTVTAITYKINSKNGRKLEGLLKTAVLWIVARCMYQCFGATYYLHLQDKANKALQDFLRSSGPRTGSIHSEKVAVPV